MVFPVGENEAARLDALRELSVLDSAKEPVFDSIVELARQQFRVPICLISLVDEERQWFKAVCGLGIDSTPRELAFCNYTILENKPFIVEDAKKDARFANNALVTGAPFIRFYAGVPLTIAGNLNVGSLCVIDQRPRVFGTNEIARLADLARIVVRLLEQSKTVKMMERLGEELNTERATLVARKTDMELMSNLAKIGEWCVNLATMDVFWSNEVRRIHEVNEDYQPTFETAVNFYHETVRQKLKDGLRECVETGRPWDCELPLITAKGNPRWVRVYAKAYEEGGIASKLVGAFQDITEAVQARTELAEVSRRLELAAESASIGLWDWDAEIGLFWNHAIWWHYLGFAEAPAARPDIEADSFIHPDDLPGVIANRKAFVASGGKQLVNEFRHLDGAGEWRWVSSIGRGTKFDGQGNVVRASGVYIDIHKRKLSADRVRHAAYHDTLTGLANRAEVKRRFVGLLSKTQSDVKSYSIMVLDLDRFKHVNDTYGHAAGDAVLINVAERLRHLVRADSLVARLGGDEFAIVLLGDIAGRTGSAELAKQILSQLSLPIEYEGRNLEIGVSIGIAMAPEHGVDFDTMIRNADAALYRAKVNGKNAYRFFDDEIAAETLLRRELEIDLRSAIEKKQFTLDFQPQVRFATGEVVAAEALLRWNHPTRGPVSPSQFISLAEQSELIVSIGKWVIEEACALASNWDQHIIVCVKLSAVQLGKGNLVAIVRNALANSHMPPHRLEIELTESVLLQRDDGQLSELNQLHDIGVRLVLDDFGTGYASLGYLQKLPFDKIKIDKSFTADIATNSHSAAIVQAVASLSRGLGIEATAEGIETEAQATMVKAAGCTLGQGFYFQRPVPPRELFAFLDAWAKQLQLVA